MTGEWELAWNRRTRSNCWTNCFRYQGRDYKKSSGLERVAGVCAGGVQVENKKPGVRPGLEVIVHDERFVIGSVLDL